MKQFILSCVLSVAAIAPSQAQQTTRQLPVYLDQTKPVEQRIDDAISRMTLAEKIRIIHAQSKFSSAGVPRLGFPDFWTDDGPHGVRPDVLWDEWEQAGQTNDSCVAFPALTCLAASWNPQMSRSNALALLVDIVEQEHNHKEKQGRTRYHEPQMLVARRKLFLISLLNMREHRHNLATADRRIENGSRLPGKLDILVRALLLTQFGVEQIGNFPERTLVHHSQLDIADSRTQKAAEELFFIAKLIVGQAAIKLYNGILMGARFRHRQPLIAQSQSLLHIAYIACPHLLHLQIKVIIMAECAVYCSLIGITLAGIIFLQGRNVGIICHLAIQVLASPEVVAFALSIKIAILTDFSRSYDSA